jgi:hypothetical protein
VYIKAKNRNFPNHNGFFLLGSSGFEVNTPRTFSPDIVFYFIVYKFKSLLLVRRLMVFKFVYFVVL